MLPTSWVQAILIYISGAWIAVEITDYIINNYGMNSRVRDILSVILLCGLPVAIFLSWYLGREKEDTGKGEKSVEKEKSTLLRRFWRRRWFILPGVIVLLLLLLTGIRGIHRQGQIKWARYEALPLMEENMHDWKYSEAFRLREQAKKYIPGDPEFKRLDSLITTRFTVLTEPDGASVYYREYPDVDGEWIFLGTTPIERKEMPDMTMYRWKLEMPGYETILAAATTHEDTLYRVLPESGTVPDGMVYVDGINEQITGHFLSGGKQGFYMDKYEVSNREYKEFMNAGAYQNPDYWEHDFVMDSDTLGFEKAMDHFLDASGRSGPATWHAGDFTDGEENYPVNGISWYEAAAYAGKSLPTVDHWRSAAGLKYEFYNYLMGSNIIPLSNMDGNGPEKSGSNQGMGSFGIYDVAGNVREWCWNMAPAGRIILGGAWNDVSYMSGNISQLPAFDRSGKNGLRCMILPENTIIQEDVFKPVELSGPRNYYTEKIISELEFEIMKKQFLYDKTVLNSLVEKRDESAKDWVLEKISFDAAYEQERMIAYLFLPVNAEPPYQTLVYFPGSTALETNNIFQYGTTSRNLFYILKNGRAVIFPIYKGTFERRCETCTSSNPPVMSHQQRECIIKWVKDLSRSIDYLESREDIDLSHIGFLGDSWGGRLGALIPAVEDRIKLNIMLRGGLRKIISFPEVDEFNYVSHVTVPTLMINGKYDFNFPYETSVLPMFDLLGTPDEHKKLVMCDTDHFIPTSLMIKEVLDWLDSYFGQVTLKER